MEMNNDDIQLKIEFYSGYKGEETPRRIWLGSSKIEVKEILKRWNSPGHRYFKIKGENREIYTICQDVLSLEWELS